MMRKKKDAGTNEQPKHQPTERERAILQKFRERRDVAMAGRLKLSQSEEPGTWALSPEHKDFEIGCALLANALGTADEDFINGILAQLMAARCGGRVDAAEINFMISVIKGINPTDQVLAMLGAQMAAVHVVTMTFLRRLSKIETLPQQDAFERAFNKLTRTFTMQMDALKRYRTGGEQKVTVQHVSISQGAQAIVGTVNQSLPQNRSAKSQSDPQMLSHSPQPEMPIIEPLSREALPLRRKKIRR